MPMSLRKRGASPPFSYVLFVIAFVEALFWFAPLMEGSTLLLSTAATPLSSLSRLQSAVGMMQPENGTAAFVPQAGVNAEDKDDDNSKSIICGYIARESFNLKRTTQRWKVVGIEEQEEYELLQQLRNASLDTDAELFHQQQSERLIQTSMAWRISSGLKSAKGASLEHVRRSSPKSLALQFSHSTIGVIRDTDSTPANAMNTNAARNSNNLVIYSSLKDVASSGNGFALYSHLAMLFIAFEVYGQLTKSYRLRTFALSGCIVLLALNVASLPAYALDHQSGAAGLEGPAALIDQATEDDGVEFDDDIFADLNECLRVDSCSFHGSCVSSACICDPGWTGADCSIGVYNSLFMTIIECKAVLGLVCALAAGVYLFVCGWLSVSWLHFAKALVLWYKHRNSSSHSNSMYPYNDDIGVANDGLDDASQESMEAQTLSPRSAQRVFVNEQEEQGWLGRVPLLVREFRFKINVIHDALLTVATVLPAGAAAAASATCNAVPDMDTPMQCHHGNSSADAVIMNGHAANNIPTANNQSAMSLSPPHANQAMLLGGALGHANAGVGLYHGNNNNAVAMLAALVHHHNNAVALATGAGAALLVTPKETE